MKKSIKPLEMDLREKKITSSDLGKILSVLMLKSENKLRENEDEVLDEILKKM